MDPQTIREHILRAQDGDAEAFAEVFEFYRKTVYAIAYRIVGPDDADDVVMETYLKSWRAVPKFNQRSAFKTWLYRVTHNCSLDFLRARKRRRAKVMREDDYDERGIQDLPDTKQQAPDELLSRGETAAAIRAAMAELAEPYKTTLFLRFSDGLAYGDIAAATDVSIGTVMSRIFYGRRKLQKLINARL
ncbi:MAG: RNA polymerase sigma-70 factor (ECF subfamily) [Rhodothermales bacterium]|jgi:RNA polymerase sigma-70 factor (ECF subfamily)